MFYPYEFTTPLVRTHAGQSLMGPSLVLDAGIAEALPFDQYPRLRVNAELNGRPHEGAWVPLAGIYRMMISKRVMTALDIALGDPVHVAFELADQDGLPPIPEIDAALEDMPDLREAWDAMPIGKRRSWAYRIAKLKSPDAKQRNVAKLIDLLV